MEGGRLNPKRNSRLPLYAFLVFVALMGALPAEAHLNTTGMGPIYDGLMHFLMSPEDLVPVLALALLAGLRGAAYGRRALFVLPIAWFLGGLAGLTAAAANPHPFVAAAWFLLLGGLLAADAKLSLAPDHGACRASGALPWLLERCRHGAVRNRRRGSPRAGVCGVRTGCARCGVRRAVARALGANRGARRRELDRRQRSSDDRLGRSIKIEATQSAQNNSWICWNPGGAPGRLPHAPNVTKVQLPYLYLRYLDRLEPHATLDLGPRSRPARRRVPNPPQGGLNRSLTIDLVSALLRGQRRTRTSQPSKAF